MARRGSTNAVDHPWACSSRIGLGATNVTDSTFDPGAVRLSPGDSDTQHRRADGLWQAWQEGQKMLASGEIDVPRYYGLIQTLPPEQAVVLIALLPPTDWLALTQCGSGDPDYDRYKAAAFVILSRVVLKMAADELTQVFGALARAMRRAASYPHLGTPEAQQQLDPSTVAHACELLDAPEEYPTLRSCKAWFVLAMAIDLPASRALCERAVERVQQPELAELQAALPRVWKRRLLQLVVSSALTTMAVALISSLDILTGDTAAAGMAAAPPLNYLLLRHFNYRTVSMISEISDLYILPRRVVRRVVFGGWLAMLLPVVLLAWLWGEVGALFWATAAATTCWIFVSEGQRLRHLIAEAPTFDDFMPDPEAIGGPPG